MDSPYRGVQFLYGRECDAEVRRRRGGRDGGGVEAGRGAVCRLHRAGSLDSAGGGRGGEFESLYKMEFLCAQYKTDDLLFISFPRRDMNLLGVQKEAGGPPSSPSPFSSPFCCQSSQSASCSSCILCIIGLIQSSNLQ